MNNKAGKRNISLRLIAILQGAVLLYTLSSVSAKFAAGYEFFSSGFFVFYGAELCVLGVYALVWQQILKRVPVSVAYANRATGVLWGMLAAALFFGEAITVQNLAGVAIILAGTLLVDSDGV